MKLASQLKVPRPVYALNYVYETNVLHTIPSSIEGLAQTYIDEILMVQAAGPYYLFGFSYGATIAFEIARQLEAMGHEIGHLCLVEPPLNTRTGIEKIRDIVGQARTSGPRFSQLKVLVNVLTGIVARRPKVIARLIRTWWHRQTNTMTPPRLRWVNYLTHMAPSVRRYRFESIRGPLDFFYRDHGDEAFKATEIFWKALVAGKVIIHRIDNKGEHLDLMHDDALKEIAELLDARVFGSKSRK